MPNDVELLAYITERLNQLQFAKLMGVQPSTVHRWLQRYDGPKWNPLQRAVAQAVWAFYEAGFGLSELESAIRRGDHVAALNLLFGSPLLHLMNRRRSSDD